MADINPSTDNVRAMLTETLGRLRNASEEYFGLLEKGLSSSPLPIADQAKQFCNFMQRNVTATFDLGDKLSQAKDMQEALKIQSEFFQDQMRTMTDQAKSMGKSAMKAATGVLCQGIEPCCCRMGWRARPMPVRPGSHHEVGFQRSPVGGANKPRELKSIKLMSSHPSSRAEADAPHRINALLGT